MNGKEKKKKEDPISVSVYLILNDAITVKPVSLLQSSYAHPLLLLRVDNEVLK